MRTRRVGGVGAVTAGASTLARLALATGRLWRAHGLAMAMWFCAGFVLHTLGLQASAQLGARHAVWAMLAFVVGVVATLVALVLMIHSVEPGLRTPARIARSDPAGTTPGGTAPHPARGGGWRIPRLVFVREPRLDVVATAVGPFLAVYAVWGFVNDEVRELFTGNYTVQGLGGIDNFSISFSPGRLPFYVVLAVSSWVLRQLVAAVTRRRRVLPLALAGIVLEALWVFSFFAAAFIAAGKLRPWLRTRAGYVGLQDARRAWIDWLPDWTLPFGVHLPEAVDRVLALLVGSVLPGVWNAVLLPLVWLALTASVLGWREFRSGDVLAGTRIGDRWAGRLARVGGPLGTLMGLLTSDLRTKYLPVLAALRMISRAGPGFVGVYLLLATVLTSARQLFDIAVTVLLGPRDVASSLLTDPAATLVSGLIFTTLAIALYAAAFDEALAGAAGRSGVSGGTPPPSPPAGPPAASAPGRRSGPG